MKNSTFIQFSSTLASFLLKIWRDWLHLEYWMLGKIERFLNSIWKFSSSILNLDNRWPHLSLEILPSQINVNFIKVFHLRKHMSQLHDTILGHVRIPFKLYKRLSERNCKILRVKFWMCVAFDKTWAQTKTSVSPTLQLRSLKQFRKDFSYFRYSIETDLSSVK